MKKIALFTIVSIMCLVIFTGLVACKGNESLIYGIEIEDDTTDGQVPENPGESDGDGNDNSQQGQEGGEEFQKPVAYEEGAVNTATDIFFGIIYDFAKIADENALSLTMQEEIKKYLKNNFVKCFESCGIVQNDFMKIVRKIEASKEELLTALKDQKENGLTHKSLLVAFASVYSDVVSVAGVDKCGKLFYAFTSEYFEYMKNRSIEKYEQYGSGYEFYLEFAERYAARKEGIENLIGVENFSVLTRLIYAVTVFNTEEDVSTDFSDYSASEIREILKLYADAIDGIELTAEGWQEVLLIAREFLQETALEKNIIDNALKRGEVLELAKGISAFVSVVSDVIRSVSVEETEILLKDGFQTFIAKLITRENERLHRGLDVVLDGLLSDESYILLINDSAEKNKYLSFLQSEKSKDWAEISEEAKQGKYEGNLKAYILFKSPIAAFLIYGND